MQSACDVGEMESGYSIFLAVRMISGGRALAVAEGTELDTAARAGGDGLVTVVHIWGSPQEDSQGGYQQAPPLLGGVPGWYAGL